MPGQCRLLATLSVASLLLAGCAQSAGPAAPAVVQQELADSRIEFRELVGRTVSNADRAATVRALLDRRDQLVRAQADNIERYQAGLRKLNADYGASREAFEALINAYNQQRRLFKNEFLTYTADMKAATTRDEWRVIADYELQVLNRRGTEAAGQDY